MLSSHDSLGVQLVDVCFIVIKEEELDHVESYILYKQL